MCASARWLSFYALAVLEIKDFLGEDACACGINNVSDYDGTLNEYGLEEFVV